MMRLYFVIRTGPGSAQLRLPGRFHCGSATQQDHSFVDSPAKAGPSIIIIIQEESVPIATKPDNVRELDRAQCISASSRQKAARSTETQQRLVQASDDVLLPPSRRSCLRSSSVY